MDFFKFDVKKKNKNKTMSIILRLYFLIRDADRCHNIR